ncbi:MAG: Mur ligase family protein [Acholeplasmataceae bacterium]
MTYQEAYEYLDSLHNLPRVYRGKGNWQNTPTILKGMHTMLHLDEDPQLKIPHYIHVTGTSGKGSVSLMISRMLVEQGFKVGTITSPHPTKITERWQINGRSMTDKDFVKTIEELKPVWDAYINQVKFTFPSMASLNTLIALHYFAKQKVDFAVMEVVCGGKNDSTNIIPHKDVAIITNIGLDHLGVLGTSKEVIALNKSGIIKKGCDVITAEGNPKIIHILKVAAAKKKARSFEEVDASRYSFLINGEVLKHGWGGLDFRLNGEEYHINNLGYHQVANARVAIAAAKKLGLSQAVIRRGLANTVFPIRFEVVAQKPYIILDGAHNPDKVRATISSLKSLKGKYKKLHLLIGFSDNKDHSSFLDELLALKPKSLACTRFTQNIFRKTADPKKLKNSALKINPRLKVGSFLDPKAALAWSQEQLGPEDLLLVTGSMFLSGELRSIFKKIE